MIRNADKAPNRTKLELKLTQQNASQSFLATPNRTKLELKRGALKRARVLLKAPNRTKLELKHRIADNKIHEIGGSQSHQAGIET